MSSLENMLAFRYFRRRLITIIATLAVAVSVFIVIVVMTIMNGLVVNFKDRNHDFFGDCIITSDSLTGFPGYEELSSRLLATDFVEAISPAVRSYAIMTREGWTTNIGVNVVGIDPALHSEVTNFSTTLLKPISTAADAFKTQVKGEVGCIMGIAMMNRRDQSGNYSHNINQDIKITLTTFPLSSNGMPDKKGADISSSKTFPLANDSDSRLAKEDNYNVYIPLEQAQLLCGMGTGLKRVTELQLKFAPGISATDASQKVREMFEVFKNEYDGANSSLLENVSVQSWKQYRREIIAPVEKEEMMLTMMFLLIGLVTVFVVLVVFVLLVNSKNKDIGIMKSFGASSYSIASLFVKFAALTGLCGATLGAGGAILFLSKINALETWLFDNYGWQLWDRSMYVIDEIPDKIRPNIIIAVVLCAIISSVLGALMPAITATLKRPADTLRIGNI